MNSPLLGLVVKTGTSDVGSAQRRALIKVYSDGSEQAEFWISDTDPQIGDKYDVKITKAT